MKLLLLHGPAIKVSRIKLQELKSKFSFENVMVFEKGEDMGTILANLQSVSLFGGERLVILENPPDDLTIDLSIVHSQLSIILWFDHEVTPKKPIMEYTKKNGRVLYFPESKEVSVFPFLDYLAAKDKKAFLELNKLKAAGFDVHYLIAMVFYLLRSLICTPKNASSFVKDKLSRQRKNFPLEKVTNLYREIIEIDFKIKSGFLEKSQAEFLLVNKFIKAHSITSEVGFDSSEVDLLGKP